MYIAQPVRRYTIRRFVASYLLALTLFLLNGCGEQTKASGPHLEVSLVADQESVTPGSRFTLGVHFKPDPGWHIYWKNAGDSGLPPQFSWSTPPEIAVQAPVWPYPERIVSGPLVNYGLGATLLPFPTTASSKLSDDAVTVSVHVEWLVCKDECLPGEANLSLTLPVTTYPGAPSLYWKDFETAFSNAPVPLSRVSIAIEERLDEVVVALIPLDGQTLPSDVTLIPEDKRLISNSAPQRSEKDGDVVRLFIKRDPFRQAPITRLRGVLIAPLGWSPSGNPKAVTIDTNPGEPLPESNSSTRASSSEVQQNHGTFFTVILSALLGGMLLNLMPCVFPILSIKILGFVEHAHRENSTTKKHGIFFTLGVIVSFWILAGILLIVRAGGEQLGWGFQLQSPIFVIAMLCTFMILGLLFLSDLVVGQKVQTLAGGARLPTNLIGSFLNGILATAVATPCTAPFMSTALAATLTLPAPSALAVFTALGIGMSLPYLILSFFPTLLRFLPKPGSWMETFKQLMAFPLFASVVWLCRVYARQIGFEPPGLNLFINVLWALLCIGFGFWIITRVTSSSRKSRKNIAYAAGLISIILGLTIAIPNTATIQEAQHTSCAPSGEPKPFRDAYGLLWESYSEERLARILAQGRPVFIDFTAEWCITCQVNERVVFGSKQIRNLIVEKNVTLVRADWTSKNPAITKALRKFGRNGVPVNVLIAATESEPLALPNILTPGIVADALNTLPTP